MSKQGEPTGHRLTRTWA